MNSNCLGKFLVCVSLKLALTSAFDASKLSGMSMLQSGNVTAKMFSVKGPLPNGLVVLFMEETNPPQFFNYTVECKDDYTKFVIKVSADDSACVTFESDDVIIDCSNRTLEVLLQDVNNSLSNPSAQEPTYKDATKREARFVVQGTNKLHLNGDMLGRTFLTFSLYNHSDNNVSEIQNEDKSLVVKFPVVIFRKLRTIDHAFQVVIYVFMVFVTLAFGCKLDLDVVKENFKKPIAPCIGLGCQYIIMPLTGYGIAKLVTPERPDIALGIFVCGICPGGGASNIYSHLLGGDISLSITMTAISTILALGMMPLWLYTLGQEFLNDKVNVPFTNIVITLAILILPLFVGLFVKYKLPKVKRILMKVVTPVTVICVILLMTVGIYSNQYLFRLFKPKILLAGCLLPYLGYILGGIVALIARLPWGRVKTVAIETGMQNVGIAMIIMMFAFPPPDGYLAAVAPIASGVMTPLPLFVITIPYLIYRRCNKEKYDSVPTENGKKKENEVETTIYVENGKTTVL